MPKIFVPKEREASETRVALTPAAVKMLAKRSAEVLVEAGAGSRSHLPDADYKESGATLISGADVARAWSEADIVLTVAAPTTEDVARMHEGALLVGFLDPYRNSELVAALCSGKIAAIPMELIPRISRAQTMDALSSQASIAGYKAALLAATHLDKYFPLLMTAAGTIKPSRVVIMGAGVAGLQAIATAKRLGAIVEVSDIRAAVKEEVESLGAAFIELPRLETGETGDGKGGYARQVSDEFLKKQREIVARHVRSADAVITTALVPGKPAPRLISEEMVESMRPGAVIVDLAVSQGGNCALSRPDETVVHKGVTILGVSNLAATLPLDASTVYARNLVALLELVIDKDKDGAKDGAIALDLEDEVIAGALLIHDGRIRKPELAHLGPAARTGSGEGSEQPQPA